MAGERKHRLRDVERIRKFRLLDDVFMKEVLRGNLAGVQDIIQTLLKRSDLEVIEVQTQDELSNLVGHGVRLDILARDSRGRYYNIEIQRSDSGAEPKRARFNLSAVDWHKFPSGATYDELAETWIIFITETDVLGGNLPVYTIDRVIRETGEWFRDEGHILYVNGAYVGDDAIGRLMADFRETDPKKMHFSSLAERAQYFKNTEGGVESMCRVMEEVREEGRVEGRAEGRVEGRAEGRVEGRAEGRVEGRAEGRVEARNQMIAILLMSNLEEDILYDERFKGLHITQEEINAAKERLEE